MRALFGALLLSTAALAQGVGVVSGKHNLSASGPGAIRAASETQVCIFCHTPHHGLGPGSNRPGSAARYEPYNSTTMVSLPPGAPSGATRVCLSCHDGTIALGQTVSNGFIPFVNTGAGGLLPQGASNLGTDLRRSHPVSFAPAVAASLRAPPAGDPVRLDAAGRLQCTSCHDPHQDRIDPVEGKFLVKPNRGSAICLTCHVQPAWVANPSAHQSSTAFYDSALGAATPWTTVADNACSSCHRPHGTATMSRLLRDAPSQLCMPCHNGRVARNDLAADFAKPYAHPSLTGDPAVHDAAEGPLSAANPLPELSAAAPRHAECVDCHEPHSAFAQAAAAPRASGPLAGAWGIDRNGQRADPAQNQYEICFKCHADSANQPQVRGPTPPETVRRAIPDFDLRRVFDMGSAASFHPVEGPGRSAVVPGLLAPWNSGSIVYCTDCHASDSGPGAGRSGPAGPHGSIYPHILERSFSTADYTGESVAAYALCYKCHDRNALFSPQSGFPSHASHVQLRSIPCSACHDWHGVSALSGSAVNHAHLIDFDVSIVRPNAKGARLYQSAGFGHGSCSVSCHGGDHDNRAY